MKHKLFILQPGALLGSPLVTFLMKIWGDTCTHFHSPPLPSRLKNVFLGICGEDRTTTTTDKKHTRCKSWASFTYKEPHVKTFFPKACSCSLGSQAFSCTSELHYRWLKLEVWWLDKWGITWSSIILVRILWGRKKAYAIILIFFF